MTVFGFTTRTKRSRGWLLDEAGTYDNKLEPGSSTGASVSCTLLLVSPGPSTGGGGVEGLSCFTLVSPFGDRFLGPTCPLGRVIFALCANCSVIFPFYSHPAGVVPFTESCKSASDCISNSPILPTSSGVSRFRGPCQLFRSEWLGFLQTTRN